jgi:uncharacterized membrane protein
MTIDAYDTAAAVGFMLCLTATWLLWRWPGVLISVGLVLLFVGMIGASTRRK